MLELGAALRREKLERRRLVVVFIIGLVVGAISVHSLTKVTPVESRAWGSP